MHHKFKAFESSTYGHDGRVFGIHYGSGHLLGVMAREELKVSDHYEPSYLYINMKKSCVCPGSGGLCDGSESGVWRGCI